MEPGRTPSLRSSNQKQPLVTWLVKMRVEKDDWTRSLYIFQKQVTLCFIVILVMQRAKSELCSETVSTELEWGEFSIWLISREQFSDAGGTSQKWLLTIFVNECQQKCHQNFKNGKSPTSRWHLCQCDFFVTKTNHFWKWLLMLVAILEIEMYVADRFDRFYLHQLCRQHHFVAKKRFTFCTYH